MLGVVVVVALGSVLLVLAGIVAIRLWWLNRKLRRQFGHAPSGEKESRAGGRIEIIEGEFQDVSPDRDERKH